MKFSFATQRGKNASLEEDQPQKNASNVPLSPGPLLPLPGLSPSI